MEFSTLSDTARSLGRQAMAWLREAVTIHGKGFEERVIETALKVQIGFLLFLALVAPFGGMRLEPALTLILLVQAALTYLALVRTRRRDAVFGGGLYLILAGITFVEAKRYSGLVGAIFSLEAVLSLIASYYIVALIRRHRKARRAERARLEEAEQRAIEDQRDRADDVLNGADGVRA
ncbi:MAG: hypothetical protein AAFT19_08100 [Pseudomonadota bacterium]